MRHRVFDTVRDLPEAALRDLLACGDAVERVWAAWALGLRLGAGSAKTVARAAGSDPDAGTRRHLVVLLAGFGESEAIDAIAVDDPDAHVRATASLYLARLAGARPTLWSSVRARLGDAEEVVRETLIANLTANAPREIREAALQRISDPAPSVREAVIAQLDQLHGPRRSLPEPVKAWAMQERERDLRRLLFAAWRAREGGASLIAAAARARMQDLELEALAQVAANESPVSWVAVRPLAEGGIAKVVERVFALFERRMDEVPLGWLLKHVAGRYDAVSYGIQLLPRLREADSLAADERAALTVIARHATEDLSSSREWWEDEDYDEWERWRSKLLALVAEARRLCGAGESVT